MSAQLQCTECNYSTSRKYNYDRHIATVHQTDSASTAKGLHQCQGCTCAFVTKYNLERHQRLGRCKGLVQATQCPRCSKVFSRASSRNRHLLQCTAPEPSTEVACITPPQPALPSVANVQGNLQIQNNTSIGTQNNTIVLNFPNGMEDQNFQFMKDHITTSVFERLMGGNTKPAVGFARYASGLLNREENHMLHKTNPNTKYCKTHKDGRWEYVLDEDAFPVLMFHMSCAALEDTHKYKTGVKQPKIDIVSLLQYLDDLNTENDDNTNYASAIERLKLIIINLSQQHKIPSNE